MNSSNVIVGSGKLYTAPIGSTLPTLDGSQFPVVWPVAWVNVGYTDAGVELDYTPTFKDIIVDEEMAAIKKHLTSEKCFFKTALAEATLDNLNLAIAGSALSTVTTKAQDVKVLKFGSSQADNLVMVGFEGPAPGAETVKGIVAVGLTRVIIMYIAKSMAAMTLKFNRLDKVLIPVEFEALADPTKNVGERLAAIYDLTTDVTS